LDQGDRRIKVGAAHRPQERYQSGKNRDSGPGVGDERDGQVSCGKPLRHDSGADHGGREQQ
jgi:hypothetical protein